MVPWMIVEAIGFERMPEGRSPPLRHHNLREPCELSLPARKDEKSTGFSGMGASLSLRGFTRTLLPPLQAIVNADCNSPMLNVRTGRLKPLRVRDPTSGASAKPSAAVATRDETRICPSVASPHSSAARLVTVPLAPQRRRPAEP